MKYSKHFFFFIIFLCKKLLFKIKMKNFFYLVIILLFIHCNNNDNLIESQKIIMKIIKNVYNINSDEKDFEINLFHSLEIKFNLLDNNEKKEILKFYNYYLNQFSIIQNMGKEKFIIILQSIKKVIYSIIKDNFFISKDYNYILSKILEKISINIVNREENIINNINESFEIYLINQDIKKKYISSLKKNVSFSFDKQFFRENKINNMIFLIFSNLKQENNLYASIFVKTYFFDFENKIIKQFKSKHNSFEIYFNLNSSRDYSSCSEIDIFDFTETKRKSIQNFNNNKGTINIKCVDGSLTFNYLTVQIKEIRKNKRLTFFMIILISFIIFFPLQKKIKSINKKINIKMNKIN